MGAKRTNTWISYFKSFFKDVIGNGLKQTGKKFILNYKGRFKFPIS